MARVICICNQKGGVGKCMAPETPVFLASGELMSIEDIFKKFADMSAPVIFDEEGGVFLKPNTKIKTLSLDESCLKLGESEIKALYRGTAQKLFEVKSSKGKIIRVTARHPFLVLKNGDLRWTPAGELREGDFIAAPREVDISQDGNVEDVIKELSDNIYLRPQSEKSVAECLQEILESSSLQLEDRILWEIFRHKTVSATMLYKLSNKAAVFKHLSRFTSLGIVTRFRSEGREFKYQLSRERLVAYLTERGIASSVWRKLDWPLKMARDYVYRTRFSYQCRPLPVSAFLRLDKDLAVFLALILAEGYIGPSRIRFYNSSPELVRLFESYCKNLGFAYKKQWLGSQWELTIDQAGTLMKLLNEVFEVPIHGKRKSSRVKLPIAVLKSPREILAAYLGAYIGCDGYVAKDRAILEITSASYENVIRLHYAFLRFGINGRIRNGIKSATNSPHPQKRMYYTLSITNAVDLGIIAKYIPVLVTEKRERIKRAAALIHSTNVDVIPVGRLLYDARMEGGLLQREIGTQGTIADFENGRSLPSRESLYRTVTALTEHEPTLRLNDRFDLLTHLADGDVFWERVNEVKVVEYGGYVYDLTVENTHNFIAGFGSFIVHNTTTAVNLGAYLAALGRRVLLIDFDPQANATSSLTGTKLVGNNIYHGLIGAVPYDQLIRSSDILNYHYIPAASDLSGALVELVSLPGREYYLRNFVHNLRQQYDYVLIDLPPSLSLLTINGLIAADEIIIPVQAEYYSLEGLSELLQTVDLLRERMHHPLRIAGAVVTMYDKRERLAREVAKNLRLHFPHKVFNVEIPRAVSLAEAPGFGKPILIYDPESIGANAYRRLAEEVIAMEDGLQNEL